MCGRKSLFLSSNLESKWRFNDYRQVITLMRFITPT